MEPALNIKGEHFSCDLDHPHKGLAHSNKKAEAIWSVDDGDGYHTFGELYRHRHALFISMMKLNSDDDNFETWWTREHHPDNDPMFEDMILAGFNFPWGSVQYHLPVDYASTVSAYAKEIPHGPYYDGLDNPDAAVKRLEQFIGYEATKWQEESSASSR